MKTTVILIKNEFGKEILSKEITSKSAYELLASILSASLIYGIDRIERALKNTYTKYVYNEIISRVNFLLKNFI